MFLQTYTFVTLLSTPAKFVGLLFGNNIDTFRCKQFVGIHDMVDAEHDFLGSDVIMIWNAQHFRSILRAKTLLGIL